MKGKGREEDFWAFPQFHYLLSGWGCTGWGLDITSVKHKFQNHLQGIRLSCGSAGVAP